MLDLSLVLVAHRSSALLSGACDAFRKGAAEAGLRGEVVVVEQSEDAGERERVAALLPERLLERPNRGYAAGINAGIEAARGEILLVGNPDVELASGAVPALLDALKQGWDVVGPQFELAGFRFPPADPQTPGAELRRWLATTGAGRWQRFWRSELERWERVWLASAPVAVPTLSGALLAFHRGVWESLGPWDEGYFLYFEETEWLLRGAHKGLRLAVVPTARASHAWGHAADPVAQQGRWASSRRRYFQRNFPWSGPLVARLPPGGMPFSSGPWPPPGELMETRGLRWLLSPSSSGLPAARWVEGSELSGSLLAFSRALSSRRELLVLAVREDASLAGIWRWLPPAESAPGASAPGGPSRG